MSKSIVKISSAFAFLLLGLICSRAMAYDTAPQWQSESNGWIVMGFTSCRAAADDAGTRLCVAKGQAKPPDTNCTETVRTACAPLSTTGQYFSGTNGVYIGRAYCADFDAGLTGVAGELRCTKVATKPTVNKALGPQPPGAGCQPTCGNPVNVALGNKVQVETDYVGSGPFPLKWQRIYNSGANLQNASGTNANMPKHAWAGLGQNWLHNYSKFVRQTLPTSNFVDVYRPEGNILNFTLTAGVWKPDLDITDTLVRTVDGLGNPTGWIYTDSNGDMAETYDVNGRLLSIANRAGLTQTLTYDAQNRLIQVADPFGRTLAFAYDSTNKINLMTDPSGGNYVYAYNNTFVNLTSVTNPDKTVRTYLYTHTKKFLLTGITDENSQAYATWTYDSNGRPTQTSHAGGADQTTFSYVYTPNYSTTVTNALGAASVFNFTTTLSTNRNTSITGAVCPSCGPATATYDANGFPATRVDWNGNRTNYVYNARGLETSRTEGLTSAGASTAVTRTITTAYHATFRLPTLITEPGRTTAMTYDASGNMLTRTITDTATSAARSWTYTYNANGQPLTMDGPRTDLSDVTTYTYYANNDADFGKRGNLATITNALSQVTSITAYNIHGQPLTIVDPNGLTTTLAYDTRQRLTSRTVDGEVTGYTYDGVGQLTKVTLPDTSFLSYTYDAAHRLTQITDNLGNKIVHTLDAMGNRTQEQIFDPALTLTQTRSRVYSNLSRLSQDIGAASQTTAYGYDNQGNLTSIDGPLAGTGDTTTNLYDQLNRLTRITDPNSGQVNYGYNALDQITSVQDPRSLTTSYAYNALNNLNTLTSPDTGATQNTYDNAGNLLTQIDAKSQTTTYTYDALNRVASISYTTDPSLNVTFTYDAGTYGLGRLTGVADSTGTTSYVYSIHGRLASETRVIGGVSYVTSYTYDSAGLLATMTYPGGRQVVYTRDALGHVNGVTTTKGAVTDNLVTGTTYRPFGPEKTFTFGNSQVYTRGFDQDGRISAYTLPGLSMAVGFDNASRITTITDTGTPTNVLNFGYDLLDRVTSFTAPALSLSQGFGYDAVGNRTSQTIGVTPYVSTYGVTNNRIATTAGPIAKVFTSDAVGSITDDTVNQYAFDARGRMKQATTVAGTSQFLVNTMGQRVKKSAGGIDTVFHYDKEGRLISETDLAGLVKQEYVYLNDIPVAVYK